jgi:hypothetical protein
MIREFSAASTKGFDAIKQNTQRLWVLRSPFPYLSFYRKMSERAQEIFREMQRVLGDAYFEDFDELSETLKRKWVMRLGAMANVASTQFQRTAQLERESLSFVEAL